MLGTALFGGVFFVIVTAVEMMGFGTDSKDPTSSSSRARSSATSGAPISRDGSEILSLGAAISAFAACLASLVGASRILFSISRDGVGPARMGALSRRHATRLSRPAQWPRQVHWSSSFSGCVAERPLICFSRQVQSVRLSFWWPMLRLQLARHDFFAPMVSIARRSEVVIPAAGIALLAYTIYRNVVPYPVGDAYWYPIAGATWLCMGFIVLLARPHESRSIGHRFSSDEDLEFELGLRRQDHIESEVR